MTSCYEDALRELTATLKGGSMGTVSDRAGLVERLGTMVDAAAASHAEAGYAPDKARASARLALEAAFCAFGREATENCPIASTACLFSIIARIALVHGHRERSRPGSTCGDRGRLRGDHSVCHARGYPGGVHNA